MMNNVVITEGGADHPCGQLDAYAVTGTSPPTENLDVHRLARAIR
jgi:hypothetical protein